MLTSAFSAGKRLTALLGASGLVLSACASPVAGPSGLYAQPSGNAPVVANPTPYSAALVCEAEYARARNLNAPRIAIGRIADYTGKYEADGSGRKLTQGASLMAMSAFAKAGVPLVERYDTSVSELELKYANSKLISDHPVAGGATPAEFRRIMAGQVPGSDFYLAGGITELNFNIASNGLNVDAGGSNTTDPKGSLGATTYIMNIGLDLRLINTRTLEVVDVISYQKQILAHQVGVGVFKIWNGFAGDFSVGEGGQEPLQLGVRAVIDRATTGPTGAFVPAYNNVETNNAATRQDPNRWNDRRDPARDPDRVSSGD